MSIGTPSNPPMRGATRELTYGERAVGLSFNPGNNPGVDAVKRAYADIIDSLNNSISGMDMPTSGEQIRLFKIAITEAQAAQMWAVKAITWQN